MTQKFTTTCLIRKNTAELRKKLEKLGYIHDKCNLIDVSLYPYLYTYWHCNLGSFYSGIGVYPNNTIDCGTNEDLFLALAALSEDNDYMQWFTDGTEFILCDRYDWIDMYSVLCSGLSNAKDRVKELDKFQKATAEELIEHFKN